jgi:hypothetical protein
MQPREEEQGRALRRAPEFDFNLAIEKRSLVAKDATDIVDGDTESVALATRGWRSAN